VRFLFEWKNGLLYMQDTLLLKRHSHKHPKLVKRITALKKMNEEGCALYIFSLLIRIEFLYTQTNICWL